MEFNATFIVSTISFIVFVLIMNKILYKPIMDIIEKREMLYRENDDEASKNDSNAEEFINKKDNKIKLAKQKSHEITISGLNFAKETKEGIVSKAREDIKEQYDIEKTKMNEEVNNVKDEIKSNINDISDLITSKIIKEEI